MIFYLDNDLFPNPNIEGFYYNLLLSTILDPSIILEKLSTLEF
jgi:hypothetical protein